MGNDPAGRQSVAAMASRAREGFALRVATARHTAKNVQHDDHEYRSDDAAQQERRIATAESQVAEYRARKDEQGPFEVVGERPLHHRRPLGPAPVHDHATVRVADEDVNTNTCGGSLRSMRTDRTPGGLVLIVSRGP